MKKIISVILICFIPFLYSSCTTTKAQQGSVLGTLAGAAVGAQLGKSGDRRKNAIIGAGIGLVIGYIIGNEMDKYDRQKLNETFEYQPSHKKVEWVNPDTGKKFEVTPEPAYKGNDGRICRDAYIQAVVKGEYKQIKTTACRNPDGTWEIVK